MPKINVYLPDDLATAVREAGIAVSPICQHALAEAVRAVGQARKMVERLRDPDFDPASVPLIGARIAGRMTPRLSEAIRLARELSGPPDLVGTGHLLMGLLDEGNNLAVSVLGALDVDLEELRNAALAMGTGEEGVTAPAENGRLDSELGASLWAGLSFQSRLAIASALEVSVDLAHNYLGCEHLLIGLLSNPDNGASRALESFGVDRASAYRAVTTAVAGFAHAKQMSATSEVSKLDAISRRLDDLERRLGPVAP
jgi:ATP-dependent Clp protease ATP-binding subunit ClpC